ncbi:MAG TPA: ImmA/IrrE family metallo-endopeptidase [Isosphaeraceae bacterium]|nr:ImmA/IrrE family metallo-endopeptidase [Isosphaeraceae bacterium]
MNDEEGRWIAEVVRETFARAERPWPPGPDGPVPLNDLIGASSLVHEEVAGLNHAVVSAMLGRWRVRFTDVPEPDPPLAGFLYANARTGFIFVRRGDSLPRRRFTVAHELGHYCLHLAPALTQSDLPAGELVQSDAEIRESGEANLAAMERQANRFAAELLMPEATCRALFDRARSRYGTTQRFLVHQLSGELLVSPEAMEWRLYGLGLVGKPRRKGRGRGLEEAPKTSEVG